MAAIRMRSIACPAKRRCSYHPVCPKGANGTSTEDWSKGDCAATHRGWTLPMQAIGSNADYKLVHELLLRGADLTLKTSNGEMLADDIATRAINPSSNQFLWREKVMEYLRSKGVTVVRPAREALQTKP